MAWMMVGNAVNSLVLWRWPLSGFGPPTSKSPMQMRAKAENAPLRKTEQRDRSWERQWQTTR